MLVLAFPDYLPQAQRLASRLGVEIREIYLHRFPDRESLVRLPPSLPEHVVIFRSLDRPNDKLIELLFTAKTARELGAKRITLVAPYLCYMRQDIANQPGEAVSQRIIGTMLAELFDDVITVDPHLHRISSLDQAIPLKNAVALTAGDEIGAFLKNRFESAVLLGPDTESEQWVARIANQIRFDFFVASKLRRGDKDVEITVPEWDYAARPIVIIDDMVSTGKTIANTTSILKAGGALEIFLAVTHPLFSGNAEKLIKDAGVKAVWSTDSTRHPSSVIMLDRLLSDAVQSIL